MSDYYNYGFDPEYEYKHKKKTDRTIKILAGIGVFLLLSTIGILVYCQFAVKPYGESIRYYEMGYYASPEVGDFVTGSDRLVRFVKLDTGGFDYKKDGEYTLTISYGFRKFSFSAIVQDTEPPVLKLTDRDIYVKTVDGRLNYKDLITEVSDVGSNVVTRPGTCPDKVSLDGESFVFNEVGKYCVSIDAIDEFGNKTREIVWVTADTAPVISGFPDYYVATGSEIDFLYNISAYDDVDGDVTYSVSYELNGFDANTPGEYTITYTATDLYGLSNSQEMLVHVDGALALQERINRHEINRFEQTIYGAINLYDCGYPNSSVMEEIMYQYEPAFVAITTGVRGGSYSRGSGFIVKIDDENGWIYIMTNNHVTSASKNEYNIDFYDGTKIKSELVCRSGETNVYADIAILRVRISNVPRKLFDKLVTVHIEREYWTKLQADSGLKVAMLVEEDSVGSRLRQYSEGVLISPYSTDSIVQNVTSELVTETSIVLYHGCSGSAIIDENGNLVSMATAMTRMNPNRYWGPTLLKMLDYFEENTGICLYYK